MTHPLERILRKEKKLAIGLMSGTSVDGIDAALVEISGYGIATNISLVHYIEYPYAADMCDEILTLSQPGNGSVDQVCRMNILIGERFSSAVKVLLEEAKCQAGQVDFIGSHGQTVHHLPHDGEIYGYHVNGTLQIGEPAIIAGRTGITTVADFRPADMAFGGQGAPLVPFFDYIIFRSDQVSRCLVNIGGICNIAFLSANCALHDVLAFDTGPGNMVIDYCAQKLFSLPYDKSGKIGRSGAVSEKLLTDLLKHSYFGKQPPKSTGREMFGQTFAKQFIQVAKEAGLNNADIVATATHFTVESLAMSLECLNSAPDEIIVSGGGAQNSFLMDSLQLKLPSTKVAVTDEYGIPSNAKEAMCFAALANETLCGNPSNVASATGASASAVLGKICF